MSSTQLTSGDVLADRRADYARMMAESGEYAGAAELIEQALELAPHWAAGWFRLGEYRERAGVAEGAAEAYRAVLRLDPQDRFGAGLKLALLGGAAVPEHPPSLYVEQLFDDYAARFDKALVERLHYTVPQKLAAMVRRAGDRFGRVVDLGCGTGLFGMEIREVAGVLEGYDLSRNMLREAAAKGIYDHLARADLSRPAPESGLFDAERGGGRADLVSAADVLMYLGDLDAPLALAHELAAPGAVFAFSVEDSGAAEMAGEEGYRLAASLRYAHGAAYVRDRLGAHGFRLEAEEKTVIRQDAGLPVHGLLFLAVKAGA